ncbi:hypothetical protein BH11PLA1_BH11PLA1_09300 [soil metagenome]
MKRALSAFGVLAVLSLSLCVVGCEKSEAEKAKDNIDKNAKIDKKVVDNTAEIKKDVIDANKEMKKDAIDANKPK